MTVPERHRHTDGQTTYCGITALCVASRGKKSQLKYNSHYNIDVLNACVVTNSGSEKHYSID